MYSVIKKTIEEKLLIVTEERKEILQSLIDYIQLKIDNNEAVNLNFICTHNSRRSHLSQVWSQTFAYYYKLNNINCYSGGTEVTAIFPKVVVTLQQQGFLIQKLSDESNPVYAIKYSENKHPIICFSKTFDDEFNPRLNFAAIMTCASADEGCPFIAGAEKRIPIRYNDPKIFDGTEQMDGKYLERSIEIASEMNYVFSKIVNGK